MISFLTRIAARRYYFVFLSVLFLCILIPAQVFPEGTEFSRLRSTSGGQAVITPTSASGEVVPNYYVAPGDTLEIFVWQNPDLTRQVIIRPDGILTYPLAGTIVAAGLTINQLQDALKNKLSQYIKFPEVMVSVVKSAGNKIIVLGQINYPGVYTFMGSISVMDAIALAGDFTASAMRDTVMIVSDNFTEHPKVRKVNPLLALKHGLSANTFLLKPNDVVYVPKSIIGDFNQFLSNIAPTVNILSSIFSAATNADTAAVAANAWFKKGRTAAAHVGYSK